MEPKARHIRSGSDQMNQKSVSQSATVSRKRTTESMCQAVTPPNPPARPEDVRTLDQLKHFVHVSLCRKENLLEHHFPMSELELLQRGIRCGYQFVLHGPRCVKLAAVWAEPSNEVLLYDATGKRFGRVRLPNRVA